jgi:hypothetical protein
MMLTFREFLADAAKKGEVVNTLFEERLFDLVGVLHRITDTLSSEHIPHALIGGLAVLIHVEEANPEHSTLTRDVDLMVRRSDLDRIKDAAARNGFRFRTARRSYTVKRKIPKTPFILYLARRGRYSLRRNVSTASRSW